MPFKRKRVVSARRVIKRRKIKRGLSRSKISRPPRTHVFSRYGDATQYQLSSGTSELDVGMHFTFDQITNYGEFTSLFDRYKIVKVVIKLRMINNPDAGTYLNSITPLNAANFYPAIWYCSDTDDANPQTVLTMKERGDIKYRILRPNSCITHVVRPNILSLTYRTALTSGYSPHKGFIDAGNTDVPHYAFKFSVDCQGNIATQNMFFRVERKFFFIMKDIR